MKAFLITHARAFLCFLCRTVSSTQTLAARELRVGLMEKKLGSALG